MTVVCTTLLDLLPTPKNVEDHIALGMEIPALLIPVT